MISDFDSRRPDIQMAVYTHYPARNVSDLIPGVCGALQRTSQKEVGPKVLDVPPVWSCSNVDVMKDIL